MRWLVIVLAVLAAVAGLIVVAGMMLPQNHSVTRSAVVAAPPEKVWAAITDVGAYPEWRSGIDSVEVMSSGGRPAWREISGSDRVAYESVVSEPHSRLVTRITDKGLPYGGAWDFRLVPESGGTRVSITENGEVYNPVFRFVSRYVMGHASTIEKYLGDLGTAVAGGGSRAGAPR